MRYERYGKYKPQPGVWFDELPDHWSCYRTKVSVASCLNGAWGIEQQGDSGDLPCIRVADFDRENLCAAIPENPTVRNYTERDIEKRLLSRNDLLLEKSGGGDQQPVGAVVLYNDDHPAICSNFIARMRLKNEMNASFWRYVHYGCYCSGVSTRSIKQTSGIQNLDQHQYLNELSPFPPIDEQEAIAAFLDRETAKIDALITEQQRLIELLQEKRQAVISHAVTKGLNPYAPMRDSGVEWLGEVPEGWRVMGLTKCIGPVVDYRGKTPAKGESGMRLVTAKNIKNGKIDYDASEEYVDPSEAEALLQRGRPQQGDLLFTMEAPLGQVAIVDREDIALAQRVVKFRGIPCTVRTHYLKWWLMGTHCQAQLQSMSTGSTALGLKASRLSAIKCLIPPLTEQESIQDYLASTERELDNASSIAGSLIGLLQERRSALISAAVTGQIDVRGLVTDEVAT
ncbi:restriction endonuclease subunit S [Synechococcus sp. RSCCF101]|uniref:restriction endonuclease subunit S n=1 Tax=Synechococcus sp. RSCCF101 TaxID=2511069 RepID=UPI00124731FF|nr:restriction endonuclease subunit S [Synechococcus sp. RSCCF101]QEY31182.1 restriction endonuclease subunit S [Synechococcus sp. RSCCF101]